MSDARLTKIIYLVDWKYALERNQELTGLEWIFNHYGPYVPDVVECAKECPEISIEHGVNFYGTPKTIVKAANDTPIPELDSDVTAILDLTIDKVSRRSWDQFIQLVYSTYPVLTQPRYSTLDLVLSHENIEKKYLNKTDAPANVLTIKNSVY